MHGEEKGNLNVIKGISIRTGEIELTQSLPKLIRAWGASSKRDDEMLRTERKKRKSGEGRRIRVEKKGRTRIIIRKKRKSKKKKRKMKMNHREKARRFITCGYKFVL